MKKKRKKVATMPNLLAMEDSKENSLIEFPSSSELRQCVRERKRKTKSSERTAKKRASL
jgi:uncharacterized protein (DUF1330 family)